MHQVWLLLVVVVVTLGISATSLGQYSGSRHLDSAIDKSWQRHGGGFLNQESYAHDAFKERKLSTTIGSFGSPLTPYLGGKYDIPEYSTINIPEVPLAGGEGLSAMNHKPLKAIEGSLHGHMYINNNGKHYDRDVLIGLDRDDDKGLCKGHNEHHPHGVLYREEPIDKDYVSIVTHVHPSVQEGHLVEKFRKDPFGQDHYTAMKHNPKGDHAVQDKLVYKGHIEHLPHDVLHREHPIDKEHVRTVTHPHPSVQEEYLVEFRKDPFGQDHYTALKHNPKAGHIVQDKVVFKGHTEHLPHEVLHREHPTDKDHVSIVTHVHPSIQEDILIEKLTKDPFGKDHFTVKKHNPNGDHLVVDTIYKDLPKSGHLAVKTQEKIYKDTHMPLEVFQGKDHLTVRTEEKVFKDKIDPPMDRILNKIHKNVYDLPDNDGHHHINFKTEEIYQPKLGSYGKEHLTIKTEEKVYKDIPKSGPDKVTVENIYRTHSIRKPDFYDEPYFSYEKEYSDDKFGFEHSDEMILEGKQQHRVKEKHVNIDVPTEESFSTFRIRPTHKISWPRKDNPCDPMSQYQDNPECRISITTL